jgi:uncharacterized damage-inducible protein DinB
MKATDVIRTALTSTKTLLEQYVSDLSDADLLVRPVPGANTIAWQLGHLIAAEAYLVRQALPEAAYPELPAGFDQAYGKEGAAADVPRGVLTRAQYVELFNKCRAATLAAVAKLSDADLDRPTQGNMAKFAPTLGEMLVLVANHVMMHAGQFTVVRRKLGKPVLF